jgi:hypothetical protein
MLMVKPITLVKHANIFNPKLSIVGVLLKVLLHLAFPGRLPVSDLKTNLTMRQAQ